jgi:predicted transcriptional regulator
MNKAALRRIGFQRGRLILTQIANEVGLPFRKVRRAIRHLERDKVIPPIWSHPPVSHSELSKIAHLVREWKHPPK